MLRIALRVFFDNAEYGQAYMSDASFNAHIKVYYNLLLTGTPNSMKRFFKDLENGLATRVCFAQLPDTSFSEIPVFAPYTESERAEIIRWARELDAIGRGPALGGIPSSKESSSAARGVSAENLVHISCPQLNTATADLIKLRARKGQSVKGSSISMVLNRWRNNHRIEKIAETEWRKL